MAINLQASNIRQNDVEWVNPVGGLGDTLRISGVLKWAHDLDPSRRFHLVRRTLYTNLLKNHPAIAAIGYPLPGSLIHSTCYWQLGDVGEGLNRPYQILARSFGLITPIEERLYLPGGLDDDPLLYQSIPWRKKNIIVAPYSDSPRKEWHPTHWQQLVEKLTDDGNMVIQMGRPFEQYIRHTYTLQGLTTPRQLISLINRCDLVITSDSFAMYAAQLTGTPAVVLWGPTNHKHYGFDGQVHLQSTMKCGKYITCIGGEYPQNYKTPCDFGVENSCINHIRVQEVYEAASMLLK